MKKFTFVLAAMFAFATLGNAAETEETVYFGGAPSWAFKKFADINGPLPLSVTATEDTEFIEILVKNEDPVLATKIANEMSKVFIENVKEFYKVENVHVVDAAEVPQSPYNVNHIKDVIIFAFVGAVIAVLYVLVSNMLDTTIKSEDDIEKIFKQTVLATMPLCDGADGKKRRRN